MNIRLVLNKDIPAMLEIYSQYIDTPVTFECSPPKKNEFIKRISGFAEKYPVIVCEDNGKIIGFAYAHRQMEREAYQWNAELSVYIDKDYTSNGLGTRMYNILIDILRLQGIKNVYGVVTVPNEKSERLHLSLGFRNAGIHRCTGYKCGRWHDTAWFEKQIGQLKSPPGDFVPIKDIPLKDINKIIKSYE